VKSIVFFWNISFKSALLCIVFLCGIASKMQAQQSLSDTTLVYKMIEIGDHKSSIDQLDSATYYYKKAGQLATSLGFYKGFLDYTGHYTALLYRQARYQEALELCQKQLQVAQQQNNLQKVANAYNNMALQYQALGDMNKAAQNFMTALTLSSKLDDKVNQRKFNTNLSSLFFDLGDYKKAVQYAKNGYELAVLSGDTLEVGRSLINLINAETLNGDFKEAEAHALQALTIGTNYKKNKIILSSYISLGHIFLYQKAFQKSIEAFQKGLTYIDENYQDYEIHLRIGLAMVHNQLGNYDIANTYYTKSFPSAEILLPRSELSKTLLIGTEIKEGLGQFKEALALRKRYQSLHDSLVNETSQRTIQELEIQYETARKEATLAEHEAKLVQQQNELNRRNTWIVLSALFILFLVSVLIFIININKQKERTNASQQRNKLLRARLDGEEEERSRTARELHDGVASLLSAAKLHLTAIENQAKDLLGARNSPLRQLIEDALKEVRNISHNLAAEVVMDEGIDHALREFCGRISSHKLQLDYYLIGKVPHIPKSDELLIYRIIQEAVTNIVKHADATEAIVQLLAEEHAISITVEDNGKGFEVKSGIHSGIGLKSLASRVGILNGSYEIKSAPGKGTSIFIEFELKAMSQKQLEKVVMEA